MTAKHSLTRWDRLARIAWYVAFALQLVCMEVTLYGLWGLASLWRLPELSREHNVPASELALRSVDLHSHQPFHLLTPDDLYCQAGASFTPGTFVTTNAGITGHVHRKRAASGELYHSSVVTITPHTNVPREELHKARKTLEEIFPPKERPEDWQSLLGWGKGLFRIWWFQRYAEARVSPFDGTEDEHLWFAWRQLTCGDERLERILVQLPQIVRESFRSEQDYENALDWAERLRSRLAAVRDNSLPIDAIELDLPEGFTVDVVVPPKGKWTSSWILFQYLGATPWSREKAKQRWLACFRADKRELVRQWGRQLKDSRRNVGERMPPSSDSLALTCVIERLTGTDPQGLRIRQIIKDGIHGTRPHSRYASIQHGVYPLDEINYVGAGEDRLALFPYHREDREIGLLTRVAFFLAFLWGSRGWVHLVIAKLLLRLSSNPMYLNYRRRHRLLHGPLGWGTLGCLLLIPLATWAWEWHRLPIQYEVLLTPWQLLIQIYLSVWLGGAILLIIADLTAVLLIRFDIDPEKTWLDEIISLPLGIWLLWYFQNDWFSIGSFVALSVIPVALARVVADKDEPVSESGLSGKIGQE